MRGREREEPLARTAHRLVDPSTEARSEAAVSWANFGVPVDPDVPSRSATSSGISQSGRRAGSGQTAGPSLANVASTTDHDAIACAALAPGAGHVRTSADLIATPYSGPQRDGVRRPTPAGPTSLTRRFHPSRTTCER